MKIEKYVVDIDTTTGNITGQPVKYTGEVVTDTIYIYKSSPVIQYTMLGLEILIVVLVLVQLFKNFFKVKVEPVQ